MLGNTLILVGLLAVLTAMGVTGWLLLRLWRTRKHASLGAKVGGGAIVAAVLYGAVGTLLGLVKAMGAVGGESIDPSQKARILGEGISEAMNRTAVGLLIWVPGILAVFFMTRARRSA